MRLIDADALKTQFEDYRKDYEDDNDMEAVQAFSDFIAELGYAPAIDAVPVEHGRWYSINNTQEHFCSECGASFNLYAYNKADYSYCPSCGAKMDLIGDETDD